MLSSILTLLTDRGTLSIQEIALALKMDSSALHPMLEMLARKDKVEKIELPCKNACSGGCTQSDSMIYYKRVKPVE